MCPRFTELTIICSPLFDAQITASKTLFDQVESTLSAILQLIITCKALPDFDTPNRVFSRLPTFPDMLVQRVVV